jgi:thymidylate synthase
MVETFNNIHEFIRDKGRELLTSGREVVSTNFDNVGTDKNILYELPHQFFKIKDYDKTVFNIKRFKTQPWWMVGEVLTEFLALNPPVMNNYAPDIIDKSYKLTPQGTCEYMYGTRWMEHNQIEHVREKLTKNPTTKKALIQTWMPYDAESSRKDSPCNINYMFLARDGKLDMTATIRSNDLFKGVKYDYFLASMMMQSMAGNTGLEPGELYFHINSLHAYEGDFGKLEKIVQTANDFKPVSLKLEPSDSKTFWHDLNKVKQAEEAAYNRGWDSFDNKIAKIKTPLLADFARVMGIKNAKFYKDNYKKLQLENNIQNPEVKVWLGVK